MSTLSRVIKAFGAATDDVDWDTLYAEQLPRVYNFFRYRLGAGPVAEDLTATTFEKAWKARHRYRSDIAGFSTWLFTIARNVATDYLRQPHQELPLEQVEMQSDGVSVAETVERRHDLAQLRSLLSALSAREQELVALKYGAAMTNREIARLTGLSESNVGSILHRVTLHLRQSWEDNDG